MKSAGLLFALTIATLTGCGQQDEPSPVAPTEGMAPATEAPVAAEATTAEAPPAAPGPDAAASPSAIPDVTTSPSPAAPAKPAAPIQAEDPATSDPAVGQRVYRQACAFCHDKGIAGAPRTGDSVAWGTRMAQGVDALYATAIRGKGAMPAKGGNPSLADSDVRAAVDYMLAQAR